MGDKYWDLEDFLAEEEHVSAVANQRCFNLGMLDNSVKKDSYRFGGRQEI